MTVTVYFKNPRVLGRLYEGPLGVYIDFYAERLVREGHCYQSGARCIHIVSDFSHWLDRKQLSIHDVNEQSIVQYLQFRACKRKPFSSDQPALFRLLEVLREIEAIPPAVQINPTLLEQILLDFEHFLIFERGLCQVSAIRHRPPLRKFLGECCPEGMASFPFLTGKDITHFVMHHAYDQSASSAKLMCWTLRAFTRYLLYKGHVTIDLFAAVPSIRNWKYAGLPEHLSPMQVQRVLDSCDRQSPIGKRDYAVLILLTRLGLRANEIASLELNNINWHSSCLTVKGKGRRQASLPLLSEVGAALADYLEHGRPQTDSRRIFIRLLAPHTEFSSSASISMIAISALKRAGLDVRRKGSHIFRHSLATELLHAGASLQEIGQVLRHHDHDTTRIYAKVDINALRSLGLPWPGGVQ